MTGVVDSGAWLQAGSTIFVAVVGVVIGFFVRRNSTTTEAIDKVREEMSEALEKARQEMTAAQHSTQNRVDGLYDDTSAIRADVAEIKGYLAAVQGDHFAFRRSQEGRDK